ncbi:MAG: exo-alpha-sialidase [Acidobacteriota bacterium]|nr:exo-alpha-sialidase [Acidobacteriota bacterium]
MITNHPRIQDGKPVAWEDILHPTVESAILCRPESEWTYSHHPHVAFFRDRFVTIWSNGRENEDAPGQRVLWTTSRDFDHWSEPRVLAEPPLMADGRERVLTAGGFHHHDGTLVAYFGDYGPAKETTRLMAVTTRDGETWSAPGDVGIPLCPNHGPQRVASGRLIMTGNIAFPYTDDPAGLSGWTMTGIYPPEMQTTSDDPAAFWPVAKRQGWPTALCEGAFIQTDDGVIRMLLRSTGEGFRWKLWVTESRDDGATWSAPTETDFSDCNAKFHLGRLPDGQFYYVGNPLAGNRFPLVLSLSRDGLSFDRHFVLGEEHYRMSREGRWKGGEYGYPHSLVHEAYLYVIVSRQKEGVEVLRVALGELGESGEG